LAPLRVNPEQRYFPALSKDRPWRIRTGQKDGAYETNGAEKWISLKEPDTEEKKERNPDEDFRFACILL
jgi:hypothetical protein